MDFVAGKRTSDDDGRGAFRECCALCPHDADEAALHRELASMEAPDSGALKQRRIGVWNVPTSGCAGTVCRCHDQPERHRSLAGMKAQTTYGAMRTADFDYELPSELIAQQPAEPRDSARLMVVRRSSGAIEHRVFRELPGLLRAGDLLVVNDTRVMAARIFGVRPDTGGSVEALLLRHVGGDAWEVLFRPARRAVEGRTFFFTVDGEESNATVVDRDGATVTLQFDRPIDPERAGTVPLPPYITEYGGPAERYQTVYGRDPRSAAAPTAGLHFTDELLRQLQSSGVERRAVTLDVGPGTFVPVAADDPRDHVMHSEHVTLTEAAAAAIRQTRAANGQIVAVGTTVVRTLEHVAAESNDVLAYDGWTALKILPGYDFRVIDAMITNFHLPRSTLLMLVSAFAGLELTREAYRQAVEHRYRFYSFGDAMLLLP